MSGDGADYSESTAGFVYVLSNEAMPGMVKIGMTSGDDPYSRVSQLYSTGVPLPFKVEFAGRVADAPLVERTIHNAFRHNRVNPKREFFEIDPDQAVGLIMMLNPVDITSDVDEEVNASVSADEKAAVEKVRSRRPNLNFEEMGISIGATLTFRDDASVTCVVVDARTVDYNDQRLSLSAATRRARGSDTPVALTPYWECEGRSLNEIYNATYGIV